MSRRLPEVGLLANLVEFPAVGKGSARFRLQVMAKHTEQDILDAAQRLRTFYRDGMAEFETLPQPEPQAVLA